MLSLAFLGWRTGVIRAATAMTGIITGIYLAGQYHKQVSELLDPLIPDPNGAKIAAFAAVFILTMAASSTIGIILRRGLKLFLLGWIDGLVGSIMGLAVGMFLVGALTLGLCAFPIGGTGKIVEESEMAQRFMPGVRSLLPEDLFEERIREFIDLNMCA